MQKMFLATGASLAALAVILGAFGAHALKARLDTTQLQVFETAVRYQMYHALALILLGILFDKLNPQYLNISGYAFIAGILLFSGSLYLLSMKEILGTQDWRFLGPITPLGGLSFIFGWVMLFVAIIKK